MQAQTAAIDSRPPHRLRSVGAVVIGFVVVVALSLGTDQVFHSLGIYPPWGEPMNDHPLLALALCYRIVYQVLGSYLTARLAPRNPMRHVWVMGFIGLALSIVGAVGAIAANMGPSWYPIALAISAMPSAWLGGRLYVGRKS
jgi:hypothetical protein